MDQIKRMIGWSYSQVPKWHWGCTKCKFITSVRITDGNKVLQITDVYRSCSSTDEEVEYIFVNSDESGDYQSSVTQGSLFAHFIMSCQGI
jgi:hypothetical protein